MRQMTYSAIDGEDMTIVLFSDEVAGDVCKEVETFPILASAKDVSNLVFAYHALQSWDDKTVLLCQIVLVFQFNHLFVLLI